MDSGDVDVIVSVTSTRYCIDAMNMKVNKPWHPWLDETNDVGFMPTIFLSNTSTVLQFLELTFNENYGLEGPDLT